MFKDNSRCAESIYLISLIVFSYSKDVLVIGGIQCLYVISENVFSVKMISFHFHKLDIISTFF